VQLLELFFLLCSSGLASSQLLLKPLHILLSWRSVGLGLLQYEPQFGGLWLGISLSVGQQVLEVMNLCLSGANLLDNPGQLCVRWLLHLLSQAVRGCSGWVSCLMAHDQLSLECGHLQLGCLQLSMYNLHGKAHSCKFQFASLCSEPVSF